MPMIVTAHGYRFQILTAGHLPSMPGQIEPAMRLLHDALQAMGAPRVSMLHAGDTSARIYNEGVGRPAELSVLEAEASRAVQGARNPLVMVSAA